MTDRVPTDDGEPSVDGRSAAAAEPLREPLGDAGDATGPADEPAAPDADRPGRAQPPAATDTEPRDDPMQASIRSEAEKRKRDDPGGEVPDAAGPSAPKDAPDPTDAPDLAGAALSRVSRFGLAGSIALIVVAVSVVLLAVLSPDSVSRVLGRGIGIVLVSVSIGMAIGEARRAAIGWRTLSGLAGLTIVGALLVVDPDRWLRPIGWVIGVVLVTFGVRAVASSARGAGRNEAAVLNGLALCGLGVGAFFWFANAFEAVAVATALLAVASGVVGVAVRSGFTTVAPRSRRPRPLLVRWIEAKAGAGQSRETVNEAVFIVGKDAPARISRFMLMMLFASVISAAGILSDSSAVVIGAMLVAPLITPMMGMALALVTGWPNWLGRSALVVLAGALLAILTGVLLAEVADVTIDVQNNSQIVSRSSPRLIDLLIATAAGAAGAYALSRKEVSDSLPGVAVSIALVPPLSVVGVTAHGGYWVQATAALLLFLTNLVAIILAGGAIFLVTGVVPLRRFAENQHRVRTAFGAVAVLAIVVVGALVANGRQIAADAIDQDRARQIVDDWLGDDTPFTVVSVDLREGDVAVVLTGPGDPPEPVRLLASLASDLGGDIDLDLQWIPRQRVALSSG